ncbi:hypothetical protein SDC9_07396 [bioreactor metagenome]|uniref:Uncharacterized protein n=1 Tax=bioreactor metagenome TaxID=1076179 RepID=A0A644T5M1_9ZZZZ|nr:hypothetical protein [Methanobrevibacter sp.]MEA4956851.1 hypothetical protein [Methanobrevibacter sp.]
MNIKDNLKIALLDQFEDNTLLDTCYITIHLLEGVVLSNLYYLTEDLETVTVYLDTGANHEIKLIPKNKILFIEPQYQRGKSEDIDMMIS